MYQSYNMKCDNLRNPSMYKMKTVNMFSKNFVFKSVESFQTQYDL